MKKKYKNILILGSHVDKIIKGIEEYITEDTLVILFLIIKYTNYLA